MVDDPRAKKGGVTHGKLSSRSGNRCVGYQYIKFNTRDSMAEPRDTDDGREKVFAVLKGVKMTADEFGERWKSAIELKPVPKVMEELEKVDVQCYWQPSTTTEKKGFPKQTHGSGRRSGSTRSRAHPHVSFAQPYTF